MILAGRLVLLVLLQSGFRQAYALVWTQEDFPAPTASSSSSNSAWGYLQLQPLLRERINQYPVAFDLVDMDTDGDDDLVVVLLESVYWWENDPDDPLRLHVLNLTTEVETEHPFGSLGAEIFADMDGDGDEDLVVFSLYYVQYVPPQTVFWFENLGSNRWNETAHTIMIIDFVEQRCVFSNIEVFDANLDGDRDVFISCYGNGGYFSGWLMAHDDGYIFMETQESFQYPSVTADINGDMHEDMVTGVYFEDILDKMIVVRSTSEAAQTNTVIEFDATVVHPDSIVSGMIDGDPTVDILLCGTHAHNPEFTGPSARYYRNVNGTGLNMTPVIIENREYFRVYACALKDLDHDGDLDIIAVAGQLSERTWLTWYENMDGSFTERGPNELLPQGERIHAITLMSINDEEPPIVFLQGADTIYLKSAGTLRWRNCVQNMISINPRVTPGQVVHSSEHSSTFKWIHSV